MEAEQPLSDGELKCEGQCDREREKHKFIVQLVLINIETVTCLRRKDICDSSLTTTTDDDENDSCFTSSTKLKEIFVQQEVSIGWKALLTSSAG